MKTYLLKFIILAIFGVCLVKQVCSQTPASDSLFHPYHVNYWVSGTICGIGIVTNYFGIQNSLGKNKIDSLVIRSLDKNDIISSMDRWAIKQDPSQRVAYEDYSGYVIWGTVFLPGFLLFDDKISEDWLDVLFMYMETHTITANIYEWSFLGPNFQDKFRPICYYGSPTYGKSDSLTYNQVKSGNNRNSFYSGHVASVAAATFFMVKVYSDYNPDIGNNKYLLYGAASIPPLLLGYFRVKALRHFPSDVLVGFGIGALCGILIPELHRLQQKNITMGLYSSPESTGISVNWQGDILK